MLGYLVFAVIGRVIIYVWMKFDLPIKNKWLEKLHACDLCSGVWIYSILAVAFNVDVMSELYTGIPIIAQLVTGIITSYLVHYFVLGWKAKHEVVVV